MSSGDPAAQAALAAAEAQLRTDGRFAWLLSGRQAWSVGEIGEQFTAATGVPVSHDTVTRWVKRLPELYGPTAAENYGSKIGWRAARFALMRFFAEGRHLAQRAGSSHDSHEPHEPHEPHE